MMTEPLSAPKQSDPAAFVARHQRAVQRWLRALGCDAQQAEEHCQDALLAALHHGIEARQDPVAAAWLRTTAKNLFLQRCRRERRQPRLHAFDEVQFAWQQLGGDVDGGEAALLALRACLQLADERDRQLLDLRYREQCSRAVMATACGIGEAGIKQALRRARTRLQQCVEGRLSKRETEQR